MEAGRIRERGHKSARDNPSLGLFSRNPTETSAYNAAEILSILRDQAHKRGLALREMRPGIDATSAVDLVDHFDAGKFKESHSRGRLLETRNGQTTQLSARAHNTCRTLPSEANFYHSRSSEVFGTGLAIRHQIFESHHMKL